ncbi:OLC1v1026656C1 [Oldenlandia corymbosa var. corymbosa]|uniref:OLC1v1026656C1 n=1 Tax=Oldenlandia corymbosa var. corymbosa TaxID=529605 RepID=A0AAV1CAJ5_OLDCO|nr:OLC1v1026656C1 [Oldenlandia corymbosa var. corymbosa]
MSSSGVPKLATTIHITALDGIVNVNSLFTLAVFIGLTWNPRDPDNKLNTDPKCEVGPKVAEDLVAFHVYSFCCFLFSSLVALALKQAIRLSRSAHYRTVFTFDLALVNKNALRVGYVISAAGSASGCLFLMLALINVVQIKLGTLSCGSPHSLGAVVPLVILVPIGLLIYVSTVIYAFTQ